MIREASLLKYAAFDHQVVYDTGLVLGWSSLVLYQLSCGLDVSEFPYDEQTCYITISPYASTENNFYIGQLMHNQIEAADRSDLCSEVTI